MSFIALVGYNSHIHAMCVCVSMNVVDVLLLTTMFKAHSTDIRATFFCEPVVNLWNNLPSNRDFSSLSAFKCSISNIYFTNYLKCY